MKKAIKILDIFDKIILYAKYLRVLSAIPDIAEYAKDRIGEEIQEIQELRKSINEEKNEKEYENENIKGGVEIPQERGGIQE